VISTRIVAAAALLLIWIVIDGDGGDDDNIYIDIGGGMQPGFFFIFGVILFDLTNPSSKFRRCFCSDRLKQHWLNR